MKRSVSVIASLVMMLLLQFCLVSCGGGGGDSGESSSLSYAFSVGDKSYMTLEDAVSSVSTKSAEKAVSEVTYVIRMLRDTTDPGATITGIDANIKLDFQDFTFTLSSGGVGIVIDNENGSVEIAGGKILVNEGSTLSSGSAVITIKSDVTITGTNVEVKAGLDAIETTSGELVIEGSTKITTTEGSKAIDAKENSKIEVNSDSVEFTGGLSISGTANVDLGEGTFHFTSEVTIGEGASLAGNKDKLDVPSGDTTISNIIENNVHEHSYGDPEWTWSEDYSTATATFTCSDDSTHVKTIDASITTDSKTEPTCTEAGSATYTASVSFNGNTYTDTVEMNIPVLGHEYGDPVWTWAEDYSSATATFTCGRVNTHVEVVTADVSNETVKTPTCTEAGTIKYTASAKLDEKTYTDIKTVEVSALGHKYGDPVWTWTEDYISATASFTCSNDKDHVENVQAEITTDSTSTPTCTEDGFVKYTATVSFNDKTYADTKIVDLKATGHTFSEDWASNSTHHWHDATCGHDEVSDKAEHTFGDWIVRTEVTEESDGEKYRTCTVCGYEEARSIPRKSAVDIEDDIAKNPKIVLTSSLSTVQSGKSVSISANVDNITGFEYQWVAGSDIKSTDFRTSTDGKVDDFTSVFNLEGTYDISLYIRKDGLIWSESIDIVSRTYTVGGIGPSGGFIFYDCDADNDTGNADGLSSSECGWRYLEAAPADLRIVNGTPTVDSSLTDYSSGTYNIYYGYYKTSADGSNLYVNGTTTYNSSNCTGTAIGTGKTNTDKLVGAMGTDYAYSSYSGSTTTTDYAARLCDILEFTKDGVTYTDWFLPSKDELNLMYTNLHKQGLGDFEGNSSNWPLYWSSSEYYSNAYDAWLQFFSYGSQDDLSRKYSFRVRPVRAF